MVQTYDGSTTPDDGREESEGRGGVCVWDSKDGGSQFTREQIFQKRVGTKPGKEGSFGVTWE